MGADFHFRLPGESQQIDRIMEAFAARYCEQNPGIFDERDTCYILCFSVIMLNTMLHNPNVKNRPSLDTFVKQNRGINSGKDLQRQMLVSESDLRIASCRLFIFFPHFSRRLELNSSISLSLLQETIYYNIKEEPFKIPDETYDDLMYTFFSPEKEGWLLKEGGG